MFLWNSSLIYLLIVHEKKVYLSDRKQRVVLGSATSDIGQVQAGVPQGSVLGPFLFLIFINNITENIGTNICLFADDTTLFVDFSNERDAADKINTDLNRITKWADKWLVSFCPSKTEALLVSLKKRINPPPPITFGNCAVAEVKSHKHLGVVLTQSSWGNHIDDMIIKAGKRVDILALLMYRLDRNTLEILYKAFIRPVIEYGDILMSNMTDEQALQIEQLQKRAGCIISGAIRGTSSAVLYN